MPDKALMGLEYTVEVMAIERITKGITLLTAEVADIRKVQDSMIVSQAETKKALVEVTKTCERIMDRLDSMDSQVNMAEKRIFSIESDIKDHTSKIEEFTNCMSQNTKDLVNASIQVGNVNTLTGKVSAGALGVGGAAFIVDLILRILSQ